MFNGVGGLSRNNMGKNIAAKTSVAVLAQVPRTGFPCHFFLNLAMW
jgi:hypothetical protein